MSNLKHLIGIFILTIFAGSFYITDRAPYSDEYAYLGHANSLYMNQVFGVIDKKSGLPITMSILYVEIAKFIGLELKIVGFVILKV